MSEARVLLAARDPDDSTLGNSSGASPRVLATSSSRNSDCNRSNSSAVMPSSSHDTHAHGEEIDFTPTPSNPLPRSDSHSDSDLDLEPSESDRLVPPPPDSPPPTHVKDSTGQPESDAGQDSVAVELDPTHAMECATSEETGKLTGECRICQEEDVLRNLDSPCTCAGSLKYAHPSCLQHWCNEKRNTLCEICHQPYKSSYTVPEARPQDPGQSVLSIEIREDRAPDGTHSRVLTLRDAVTGEETRFDLSESDEPQDPWACVKAVLLIMFFLLLLPKALMLMVDAEQVSGDIPDDSTGSMLRMIALGLPLLILLRVMHAANERQRHQEDLAETEAAEAAAHVAFLVHARHAQLMAMANAEVPEMGLRLPGSEETRPVVQGVV